MKTAAEFWARVDKTGDCWEWQGAITSAGYGSLFWGDTPAVAHRVSAFLSGLVETIAAPKNRKGGGFVLHRCDNRRCCNPEHFFIGSLTENILDMYNKARHPVYRGASHTNSKLNTGQVSYVRALYASGDWRQVDLAMLMGVSQRAISLIVRGESYV